ncbi:MAG TPA: UvrD-helicase domain-containing protein [Thermoanaerobaculia bacterium]
MTTSRPRLPDSPERERIQETLDRNLFVEAAAGTGKTRSLVDRMVAMVREGSASIERVSAVTFTIKAAAHLSERFQAALEDARRHEGDSTRRARLDAGIAGLDRCFIGTIHAFCARLLRERPVEAGVDPEFAELDEAENLIAQREAWETYTQRLFVEESPLLERLATLGVTLVSLRETYNRLADNSDVEPVRATRGAPPNLEPARLALAELLERAAEELPASAPQAGWDSFQRHLREALRLWRAVDPSRPSTLIDVLESLDFTASSKVTQNRWPHGPRAKKLASDFDLARNTVLAPALSAWREYLYPILIDAILPAVADFRSRRLAAGRLNFQDLLLFARDLLRDHPEARRDFQNRFTPILVDEFQDTDPIQAEVILYLTGRDVTERGWRRLEPIPGSLFVVGDPKQSIYRFRRADIETYEFVRERIVSSGGEVVKLASNFRSSPTICGWINRVFAPLFPSPAAREQAAYTPLFSARETVPEEPQGVFRLEVPAHSRREQVARSDADLIARWIRAALDGASLPLEKKRKPYIPSPRKLAPGDFMILLRYRYHLRHYARALEARRIPYEISGGGAFRDSREIAVLLPFLEALIDPDDPLPLVAALRGDLFGVDDRALFEFRRAGGRFSLLSEPPGATDARIHRAWRMLRESRESVRRLPPAAALSTIVERLGLVAAAAADELGETNSGNLLKAMTLARELSSRGEPFAAIVRHLRELTETEEIEEMSSDPGRAGVVRLMNLHRAKGLEAPILFLADPTGEPSSKVTWSIDRTTDPARGYFRMTLPRGGFESNVEIARPAGWDEMAEQEKRFLEAENDRLTYVAATRAEDILVVSTQTKDGVPLQKGPWAKLVPHLAAKLPELPPPLATPLVGPWTELETERNAAHEWQRQHLSRSAAPSYAVAQVTAVAHATGVAPERTRTGRGMSWGRVLHRLLESKMKDSSIDVRAYAANLLADEERAPEDLDDAVRLVDAVGQSALWKRALASPIRFVEVPFALMVPSSDLGTPAPPEKSLLYGAIDLVFEENGEWIVVDYKSDAVGQNLQALTAFYRPQVDHYRRYWEQLTGKPTRAGLFFIETGDEVWLD